MDASEAANSGHFIWFESPMRFFFATSDQSGCTSEVCNLHPRHIPQTFALDFPPGLKLFQAFAVSLCVRLFKRRLSIPIFLSGLCSTEFPIKRYLTNADPHPLYRFGRLCNQLTMLPFHARNVLLRFPFCAAPSHSQSFRI
jgi:hypothetical protein